jgi:propionyl-CoA synthetase
MRYADLHQKSISDPNGFWMEQAQAIDWHTPPTKALFDDNAPLYEWFADGMVNTCWNALDRHVEAGRGDQVAVIHDSPVTDSITKLTYAQMRDRVAALAGAMAAQGIAKGDRVLIYMPMVPEALMAMLACARLGAIHSVVFGGFAAHELAVRIDAQPKCIIAASCGIEPGRVVAYKPLLDTAIAEASHKPDFCVVLQREQRCMPICWPGATMTGRNLWPVPRPPSACQWKAAIRPMFSIPLARRASPRAWSAPRAGIWWR